MMEELKIGERITELLTIKGIDNKTFAKCNRRKYQYRGKMEK